MSDSEGCVGDPIHPETACLACGSQEEPETMVICEACSQGFHLGCFGLPAIPKDDEWQCQGCIELQRLSLGQLLVVEMPQTLYGEGQDPHFTQGLFKRQVQLQVEDARCPAALPFTAAAHTSASSAYPLPASRLRNSSTSVQDLSCSQ